MTYKTLTPICLSYITLNPSKLVMKQVIMLHVIYKYDTSFVEYCYDTKWKLKKIT